MPFCVFIGIFKLLLYSHKDHISIWIIKICLTFVWLLMIPKELLIHHSLLKLANVMMLDVVDVEDLITISDHQDTGAGVHTGAAVPTSNNSELKSRGEMHAILKLARLNIFIIIVVSKSLHTINNSTYFLDFQNILIWYFIKSLNYLLLRKRPI